MSIASRIIKNSGYLYARMAITMFISLYTTRLVLDSLGESEYGIYNVVGGAIGMLGFLNAAMASATQRFMSYTEGAGDREKVKSIFNVSTLIHVGVSIIAVLSLSIIGYILFDGILNIPIHETYSAKIVYACMTVSTAFTIVSVPYDAVLNAHENMRYYAVVGLIESILKLSVAFAITGFSSDRLIIYGILMAIIPLITLIIMRVYCHKKYSECVISPRHYAEWRIFKEMFSFAGWNIFQIAASIITNSGLGIVINMFFGTVINAAQGVSNTICGQLMALTNTLNKAVTPIITKTEGRNDRKKVLKISVTTTKFSFFLTALLGLPAIIVMPELLNLWLKNVPPYTVFFARCQIMIALCEQMTSGFTTAINATGNIRRISVWKSIIKFSVLPLTYFLFKLDYSVSVAYIILVVTQGVLNGIIVCVFCADKILGYSYHNYILDVFLPLMASTITTLTVGSILLSNFGNTTIYTLVIGLICIFTTIISFYFFSLTKWERLRASEIILSLKSLIKK